MARELSTLPDVDSTVRKRRERSIRPPRQRQRRQIEQVQDRVVCWLMPNCDSLLTACEGTQACSRVTDVRRLCKTVRGHPMSVGANREELPQSTHFRAAPITDMVWPRGNALRLPSAAKTLSVFGKKSQMVRRDFSRAVPEALRDGRWSDSRRARGWLRLTSRSRTAAQETFAMVGWSLAVEVVEQRAPAAPREFRSPVVRFCKPRAATEHYRTRRGAS
jgi:hypothetical protein